MTHQYLNFPAHKVLESSHLLDNPIILFTGRTADRTSRATLAFSPIQRRICFTQADMDHLLDTLNQTAEPSTTVPSDSFRSGWLGYFAYDSRTPNDPDATLPLAEFFEYAVSIELIPETGTCILHNPRNLSDEHIAPYLQALEQAILKVESANPSVRQWNPVWTAEQYRAAFMRTHQYLQAGDCYQVNLAMPFQCPDDLTSCNPLPLFNRFQPSFGAYLRSPFTTLLSVSPERFIRINDNTIETRPIKGTTGRGNTTAEDDANRQKLADSQKNRAENLMIVDLLRNDLSRHAEPHSVKVDELFHIETHANVHHMVSTIRATRRAGIRNASVITDALPGGSITGAPKRRAMEIIAELEAQPRGPYCGSLGYFDDAGHCDFNILIRTIVARRNGAVCWGGGGVVIDSTWEDEWQEIHTKVQRILDTPL